MMDNASLQTIIYRLQKCSVCNLFPTNNIPKLIDMKIFKTEQDWFKFPYLRSEFLTHKCNTRRLMRISDREGPVNFRCRSLHPVRDNLNPLEHDFVPFHYKFLSACLLVLEECGLYDPTTPDMPNGFFVRLYLCPQGIWVKFTRVRPATCLQ